MWSPVDLGWDQGAIDATALGLHVLICKVGTAGSASQGLLTGLLETEDENVTGKRHSGVVISRSYSSGPHGGILEQEHRPSTTVPFLLASTQVILGHLPTVRFLSNGLSGATGRG